MIRLFSTTTMRGQTEISQRYWSFTAPGRESARVFVPSCWESYPGLNRFRGCCQYQTEVWAEGNTRFAFQGVSFRAEVFLDDDKIGTHYGAYTPFECVSRNVKAGAHTLRVFVDNRFDETSALHVPNDYRSYGGITRGVLMESLSDAYIQRMRVTPGTEGETWYADVSAQVRNLSERDIDFQLDLSIAGESARLAPVRAEGDSVVFQGRIACPNAKAYSPDHPILYEARAILIADGEAIDDLIDRTGFRVIQARGEKLLLNGEPFFIRGVNRHESHGTFGCALPAAQMAHDVLLMKDMGVNAVRTCHYPNDDLFLDICDEQGILVWEESHARGLSVEQILNPNFDMQSDACIREMIDSHGNHPCIFIWGCLNECPSDTDAGRNAYDMQLTAIKRLDPSRPATAASRYPGSEVFGVPPRPRPDGYHDGDICLDLADVVSFNIYPEWYVPCKAADMISRLAVWADDHGAALKPMIISEIGAGGIYGFHSGAEDPWSEERQARVLRDALDAIYRTPRLCGVFLWQFCDGLVDEEWALSRPKTMNNKGIVDEFRRAKLGYAVVKEMFQRA